VKGYKLTRCSDGNIRYYEYENDKLEYLSQHSGGDPQRGIAFIPKRGVNTHQNEVTRAFRTVNDSMVEPVAFVVPRRAEVFQSDIYPPTTGLTPAMSSNDWFGGKDGLPPKIDLEAIFDGGEPKEIASDFKPAAPISAPTSAPAPAKREPDSTPAPAPAVAARGPPPSIKDNQSMSSLADKFADNDEEEDEQDDFDGSTYKPMRANAMSGISTPIEIKSPEPAHAEPLPPVEMAKSTPRPQEPEEPRASPEPTPAASIDPPTSVPSASSTAPSSAGAVAGAAQGLGKHLQDIKAMLEMQQKVMAEQTEKIDALTKEVAALKAGS
jgi:coronin-1B/1C/6